MRIHHLVVEAVGPFPDRHEVDLDQLSAGGLFLLEGPTGAGKSTLIDAVTFGLYGTLGSPARDDRLPSAHAAGTEPVIELVFSTSAGIFRVRRTPAFQRPKRRGQGTTRQNATAKLWRLEAVDDEGGEPLATSTQEVGTEVLRVVGLNRSQFSQTVVLPQGRFATFLRAKPDDRAAVLQDVFGTEIYQRLQDQLTELARQAKRDVAAARQEVGSAVAAFAALLPEHDDAATALDRAAAELDAGALEEIAGAVVARAEDEQAAAKTRQQGAQAAERAAQQALDAERELSQRVARRRALLAEQDTLAARETSVRERRAELVAARRAAVAAGALRNHAAAGAALAKAEQVVEEVCAAASEGVDADLTELDLGAIRPVVEQLAGERGGLVELQQLEAALPTRGAALDQEAAALAERVAALQDQRTALAGRPDQRQQLSTALDHIRREAMSVPAAESKVTACGKVVDAARDVERRCAELVTADGAVATAAAAARSAVDEEHTVRRRWIAGMAGSLAGGLTPGAPCTVCGATEHPNPAPRSPEHATSEDVERAGTRRQHAEGTLTAAKEERAQVAARLRAAEDAADGTDLAAAKEASAAAEQDLADARQAVHVAELREQELTAFDAATEQLRESLATEESAVATVTEQLRGARAVLDGDRDRCRRGAADAATVAERVHRLERRLEAAQRIISAREAQHAARRRRVEAAAALAQTLEDTEFPDAAQAAAAQLPAARSSELERELAAHDTDVARVREGLADPAITSLSGAETPAVEQIAQAHGERHAALMAATGDAGRAAESATRLRRCRTSLAGVLQAQRTVTEAAAPVLRMGELAGAGDGNTRATTLATYVLVRRFEDVVAAANERLTVMSDGRYALRRIDEREGRSRRAGLGLAVHDHVTETSRDPHTLSGGETFYVSLCLALGLADVVTSEAGGIALNTLFVDEGFGALDPHTLDGVLGELGRLQAGGRAVGIVSHVSELKERIADRIEVRRLPSGASTLTVRA